MRGAYYNEIDPYAAEWLRNLIKAGHIAAGEVDTRSIIDVHPIELRGFAQCHFFAGIGVWSRALRLVGWPDDRRVWTGSCPCQPFSAAGKGAGFADERHLWPSWCHLIEECRPPVVFGEQVASKDVNPWIDLVQTDVEALGYAFGAVAFPAAGVGAPHIRDRCYFVADADGQRFQVGGRHAGEPTGPRRGRDADAGSGAACELGDASGSGRRQSRLHSAGDRTASGDGQEPELRDAGPACGVADADGDRRDGQSVRLCERGQDAALSEVAGRGPAGGFWRDAEWIFCRDEKHRPVEPGTFPLAHGVAARVGRLRAYGNAIVAPAAAEFIGAYLDGDLA